MVAAGKVSSLRGAYVISEDRGAILGNVTNIYVNPETKKLSGIVFKEDRLFSNYNFIPADSLIRVGIDTIFVKSKESSKTVSDNVRPAGKDVKSLLGYWITTDHGRHLGHFLDMEFDSTTRQITSIHFTNGSVLPVAPHEINIGDDELIVPASSESKLKRPNMTISMLNRIFGGDSTDVARKKSGATLTRSARKEAAATQVIQH